MTSDPDVAVIAHVIRLVVAPVFLLTGVGALLSVMTNRLARVIARARRVEEQWPALDAAARELTILAKRARLANWAINLCTSRRCWSVPWWRRCSSTPI